MWAAVVLDDLIQHRFEVAAWGLALGTCLLAAYAVRPISRLEKKVDPGAIIKEGHALFTGSIREIISHCS